MALTTCPECSGAVSDRDTRCPHCFLPLDPDASHVKPSQGEKQTVAPSVPSKRSQIGRIWKRVGLLLVPAAFLFTVASFFLGAGAFAAVAGRLLGMSLFLGFGMYATGNGLIWLDSEQTLDRVLGVLALVIGPVAILWAVLAIAVSVFAPQVGVS